MLQQYLPFTVLKLDVLADEFPELSCNSTYRLRYWNFLILLLINEFRYSFVATVLTVYGIETLNQLL